MPQSQVDQEPKECDLMGIQWEMPNKKTDKLYQLLGLSISFIIQEIDKRKEDEDYINGELMRFSHRDEQMKWMTQYIKYLQGALVKEKPPQLPMRSIPWTTGFLHLTQRDDQKPVHVGPGKKRYHNRLNKERTTDFEYLQQVQEELLTLLKSGERPIHGTQQLNHVMESLVQRIQHGSNTRAAEAKIFDEIRKVSETIEIYTAPTEPDPCSYKNNYVRVQGARRQALDEQHTRHTLKLMINSVEAMKRDQKEHTAKMNRLKADRDQVRENIRCIQRVFEKVNTKRNRVYKSAYKHEGQMKDVESSYNEYQLLMTNAKELARKGDFVGLMQFLDMQVEEFMIRRQ